MTDFSTVAVLKPQRYAFVAKDKGSFGNRVDCSLEQTKNSLVTGLQATAILGAGTAAAATTLKFMKVPSAIPADVMVKQDFGKGFTDGIEKMLDNSKIKSKISEVFANSEKFIKQNPNLTKNGEEIFKKVVDKTKLDKFIAIDPEKLKRINEKITGKASTTTKVSSFLETLAKKIKANPKGAAILGGIAAATAIGLTYVTAKHFYKAGQIDQKYTDRANVQKVAV